MSALYFGLLNPGLPNPSLPFAELISQPSVAASSKKKKKSTQGVSMVSSLRIVKNVVEVVFAKRMESRKISARNVVERASACITEYDGSVPTVVAQACVYTAGEKRAA